MRLILVAVLLVLVVLPDADAWWLNRKIKNWVSGKKEKVKNWWKNFKQGVKSGRDVEEVDLDQDGMLDFEELEHVMGTRDAQEFFSMMDLDDDDDMTLEEFTRSIHDDDFEI
ncbi:uncharacterized protein LOC121367541 [Gigantopelta aegis]|uniref:uncharacterized protein LOC121367541 n=1 Tax=Gigantopelta aegis TaxID=1735272 RepID=UPI001B888BCB|nr:uncharacterized protein LOC121367541 [Gigantopelta aegis]